MVSFAGELDLSNQPLIVADLASALTRSGHVILDLAEVTFVDSTVLSTLVWANGQTHAVGGRLTLVAPSPLVSKLLAITQLDQLLHVVPALEDALVSTG